MRPIVCLQPHWQLWEPRPYTQLSHGTVTIFEIYRGFKHTFHHTTSAGIIILLFELNMQFH